MPTENQNFDHTQHIGRDIVEDAYMAFGEDGDSDSPEKSAVKSQFRGREGSRFLVHRLTETVKGLGK